MRSDLFLELNLLLPLRLLLKNAPKKTFGHTNVPQGSQRSSKMKSKYIENITFYQSGKCVSHTVNTMFFFTLALPKCHPKQKKTHCNTYSHIDIKNHQRCYSSCSKVSSHGPWRPSIAATFLILNVFFHVFFEVRKIIDFRSLLSKFLRGRRQGAGLL